MNVLATLCPCLQGGDGGAEPSGNPLVTFSPKLHSQGVVVSNFSCSGTGIALGNTPLLQTRAYFEVTVIELPPEADLRVGVGASTCFVQPDDKHLGDNNRSWGIALHEDEGGELVARFKAGDVIGVTNDLSARPCVRFYLNGKHIEGADLTPRGECHPAVSVSNGAMLEANFGHKPFAHDIPPKFEGVIFVRSII